MFKLFLRTLTWLESTPYAFRWSILFLSILFIGFLDYLTGSELAFSIFYVLPIALTAWSVGHRIGGIASLLSGLTWMVADLWGGRVYSHPLIPYWNAFVRILLFLLITCLITIIRRILDAERAIAHTDSLTGILNSRAFYQHITLEIETLHRTGDPLTLVYLDVDNFKHINDTLGHPIGDELLTQVAQIIRRNLRTPDAVARLGGDEFAILLPRTGSHTAQLILPRLRNQLLTEMERRAWPVTFSIGALTCTHQISNAEVLIQQADSLMYEVKHTSKDAIIYRME